MTTDAIAAPRATPISLSLFDRYGPVVVVVAAIIVIWYAAAVWLNAPMQREKFANAGQTDVSISEFVSATWAQDRPVLPSPHQVLGEVRGGEPAGGAAAHDQDAALGGGFGHARTYRFFNHRWPVWAPWPQSSSSSEGGCAL